jgi:peroxiredoxin
MRGWIVGAVGVIGVAGLGYASGRVARNPEQLAPRRTPLSIRSDSTIPNITVYDGDGVPAKLSSFLIGSPTVLAVFSLQCASCVAEARAWHELETEFEGLYTVALAMEPDARQLDVFRRQSGFGGPLLRIDDVSRTLMGVNGMPALFVIGNDHRVKFGGVGQESTIELADWLGSTQ